MLWTVLCWRNSNSEFLFMNHLSIKSCWQQLPLIVLPVIIFHAQCVLHSVHLSKRLRSPVLLWTASHARSGQRCVDQRPVDRFLLILHVFCYNGVAFRRHLTCKIAFSLRIVMFFLHTCVDTLGPHYGVIMQKWNSTVGVGQSHCG